MLFIKDESALHSYLEKWVQKRLGKAVFRRHFLATVLTVSGVPGKYVVTVQRLDERQPDPNTYLCSNPGYIPQVRDTVDVLWFDDTLGYVMWPISGPSVGFPYTERATVSSGQSIPNNAWTKITGMITSFAPNSNWSSANSNYTASVAGWYSVSGTVEMNGNPPAAIGSFGCTVFINSVGVLQGTNFPVPVTASFPTSSASDMIYLNAGDVVDLRVAQGPASAAYSVGLASLALHYLGS